VYCSLGNGLTGSIPDISAPTLVDISMSHNYLTGHLPPSLRDRGTLRNLDLSYNRIGGILSHNNVSAPDAIVSLEVNRLSGPLTDDDFVAASYLNILDGKRELFLELISVSCDSCHLNSHYQVTFLSAVTSHKTTSPTIFTLVGLEHLI
jgi:hypothetical protein